MLKKSLLYLYSNKQDMKRSELRRLIREEIQKLNESKAEAGFDSTDISASNWKRLLKQYNIPTKPKLVTGQYGYYKWVWKAKDRSVVIYTANDPITGKYVEPGIKDDKKNHAGYIGIKGEKDAVKGVYDFIEQNADRILNSSPYKSAYI